MLLIINIGIQTQTVIMHLLVLQTLKLNIIFYNKDLTYFDQITVSSLQNNHFCSNVIKFVLVSIKKFDTIIGKMKNNLMDENTLRPKWELQICLSIIFLSKKMRIGCH